MGESREVVVWRPPQERPEFQAKAAAETAKLEVKAARQESALAEAQATTEYHRLNAAARKLVLTQLEKLLLLAESDDFKNSPGPLEVKDLIKLAAMVANEHRLNHGLSTANVAHAVAPGVDFAKLTQEERNLYRSLLVKAGAEE